MNTKRLLAFLPLLVFAGLTSLFFIQLMRGGGSNEVPSALIGEPVPQVALLLLEGLERGGEQLQGLDPEQLQGKVSIVNIWASWCAPCRQEHPIFMELAKDDRFQIVGINYKDQSVNALRFLGSLGNPYDIVGIDPDGRTSIEWGVYGVPETFIVDAKGKISHKKVGPLSSADLEGAFKQALENALKTIPSS